MLRPAGRLGRGRIRKRIIISLVAALLLAVGAGVAFADGLSGSSEHHDECSEPDEASSTTTCTTVYDNEVKCSEEPEGTVETPAGGLDVSGNGDPRSEGELEVCSDDEGAAMQGRVIAGGGQGAGGGYIIVDGDETNREQNDSATGWARVDVGPGGASVSCGDSTGNLDGTESDGRDTQEDCNPG